MLRSLTLDFLFLLYDHFFLSRAFLVFLISLTYITFTVPSMLFISIYQPSLIYLASLAQYLLLVTLIYPLCPEIFNSELLSILLLLRIFK